MSPMVKINPLCKTSVMKMYRNFALFLILILVVGCGQTGPTTYPVTGVISYQGIPLPLGTVMFVSKQGPPKPGKIDKNGHYQLEAVAGEHTVMVVAMPVRQGRPDPKSEFGFDYTGVPEVKSLIPQKYNHPNTSGITVTVKAGGPNPIDIALK